MDIAKEIRTLINTGKYVIGKKKSMLAISNGEAKAVVISSNMPVLAKAQLRNYANISKVKVVEVPFTSIELGSVCGRAHLISTIAVIEPGDSKVLEA